MMDAESLATRRMSVYRLYPAAELPELLAPKVLADGIDVREVRVGDSPAVLASGVSTPEAVDWVQAVGSLTGVELEFETTTASAAILVDTGDVVYALTFGHGWRYLRDSAVDRDFGLDVAVRLLDPDDIRRMTRRTLSAKARVDQNLVPGGQGLWAFGLREHAELVRALAGRADLGAGLELTHIRRFGQRRHFRFSIEAGDGLHLPLGTRGETLLADLRELTRVVAQTAIQPRFEPLRWVRRLPRAGDTTARLDTTAAEMLADPGKNGGEIGIAYPARYADGPTVARYAGKIGDTDIDTDELTISDLRNGVAKIGEERRLHALRTGAIEGLDDAGTSLGGDVPALHWLAAEIVAESDGEECRYVLVDGEWFELGERYVAYVERVVTEAFANRPEWSLPPWEDAPRNEQGRVVEAAYNVHAAETDPRFLCLDRKLLKTRVHPHGFEACDLVGPGGELVHVKKVSGGTGSSVLSHLFAQGLVSAESLTDRDTWQRFVALVAEQNPSRVPLLGHRPKELVYAIHRQDKELSPRTLFTFARSALVSAAVALSTYGVPLRVCVIP